MLSKSERHAVLKYIYYYCKFAPLPTQINLVSWSSGESKDRRFLSGVSYANFLLHTLFKLVSLFYVLSFGQDVPLYQLILHLGLTFGYALTCLSYYTAYLKNLRVHSALVQIILEARHSNGKRGVFPHCSCIHSASAPAAFEFV